VDIIGCLNEFYSFAYQDIDIETEKIIGETFINYISSLQHPKVRYSDIKLMLTIEKIINQLFPGYNQVENPQMKEIFNELL